MDDDIQLPPLPLAIEPMHTKAAMQSYARAAVLADRKRRGEQVKLAKPKVHRTRVELLRNDYGWKDLRIQSENPPVIVTLCWTDDGHALIANKRNWELAMQLRNWSIDDSFATLDKAADALDGGVR